MKPAKNYINSTVLQSFSTASFLSSKPYPWHAFHEFLTPEGFQELYQNFPDLELFERHEGLERGYNQRPHDRWYLAYEESVYHPAHYRGKGIVQHQNLPECWQRFIEVLKSPVYKTFVKSVLKISDFKLRFAWHIASSSSEVSPHRDVMTKAGIHNFYFNTAEDWDARWGGATLVLGGLKKKLNNPDFSDFSLLESVPFLGNRSFFFKNTLQGWHGVKPLSCPEGKHRRLFSVIFEVSENPVKKILRKTILFVKGKKYPGEK